MPLLRVLRYGDLFLYLLAKLKWIGDILEQFFCTTRSRNNDRSVIQCFTQDPLIHANPFDLREQDLNRTATEYADLNQDAPVCYSEFRRFVGQVGVDGKLMAVPVTVTNNTFRPGVPVSLFQTRIYGGGTDMNVGHQYDVSPDGRFLINTVLEDATPPITILQNWNPEAKR